jgi:hypothetical protein
MDNLKFLVNPYLLNKYYINWVYIANTYNLIIKNNNCILIFN